MHPGIVSMAINAKTVRTVLAFSIPNLLSSTDERREADGSMRRRQAWSRFWHEVLDSE